MIDLAKRCLYFIIITVGSSLILVECSGIMEEIYGLIHGRIHLISLPLDENEIYAFII